MNYTVFLTGYRHVRLRNSNNQPMELASIFIYSKHEEELIEPCGRTEYCNDSTSAILKSVFTRVKDFSETGKDGKDVHVSEQKALGRMNVVNRLLYDVMKPFSLLQ